jgi:hypothetical protein
MPTGTKKELIKMYCKDWKSLLLFFLKNTWQISFNML